MAHSSLQVCIDSSDHWFQGTMSEDMSGGLDSSTSPSGGDCMLAAACSSRGGGPALAAPLMERRLRPPHDQNLKCPRCDSNHTKFCYYNNYSLTQPRYFCKTCRRYWTKGGTLRNIPVGGGCRKNNKKSSSKKSSSTDHQTPMISQGSINTTMSGSSINPTDLHLSSFNQFPPHLANLIGAQMSLGGGGGGDGFMENGGGLIRPIDFMESNKYEAMVGVGGYRGHDFLGGSNYMNGGDQFAGILAGIENNQNGVMTMGSNEGNYSSGMSFMDQRMMLPYDHQHHEGHNQNGHGLMDVKPNPKLLSLEWQDQGCTSNHAKESSFGYNVNGGASTLASWSGIMSGFQPSTTNSIHWST